MYPDTYTHSNTFAPTSGTVLNKAREPIDIILAVMEFTS